MSVALHEVAEFTGEIHPYADRWPMRPADEIEEMAESIRARRQRLPIVLTPEGVLVDGRNRLAACTLAGVSPWFEVDSSLTSEDEVVAYIWDANGDRRNLSKGQRAMLAALRPGSALLLSSNTGASRQYIDRARQVIQWCDTETVDAVIDGTLPLNDAYTDAQTIKATQQADEIAAKKAAAQAKAEAETAARKLADLTTNRPDLAGLVTENRLTLDEALHLRASDLAKERRDAEAKADALRRQNLDFCAGLSTIQSTRHTARFRDLIDNYQPLSHNWTATELHECADLLHAIADEWSHQ